MDSKYCPGIRKEEDKSNFTCVINIKYARHASNPLGHNSAIRTMYSVLLDINRHPIHPSHEK